MSSRQKTDLDNYLAYGVDEKHRRIFFGSPLTSSPPEDDDTGSFNHLSTEIAIRAIERMAASAPKTPIEIHMNSYGGDPYAMIALMDTIELCSCQIKFFGRGAIMSAATWIMAVCDERYLYPNTKVMVHDGWLMVYGNDADVRIRIAENKALSDKLHQVFADNSRLPKKVWAELCKRDLFLTAEETIATGLADKILPPKKRGSFRKMRQAHLSTPMEKHKAEVIIAKFMKRIDAPTFLDIKLTLPAPEPEDEELTIEPLTLEDSDEK